MPAQNEEVTTIFVTGFPGDAAPREMDNLCRFMPGFEMSSVTTTKRTTLFALFDSRHNAEAAAFVMNGQPFDRSQPGANMEASMAKTNMKGRGAGKGAGHGMMSQHAHYSPQPHLSPNFHAPAVVGQLYAQPQPMTWSEPRGMKRGRPEESSEVSTVAVINAEDKGWNEATLRDLFASFPGFEDYKHVAKCRGCFVKFETPGLAKQAADLARAEGLPAHIAKTNMGGGKGGDAGYGKGGDGGFGKGRLHEPRYAMELVPPSQYHQPQPHFEGPRNGSGGLGMGGVGKRQKVAEDPSSVDTLCCQGAWDAGFDEMSLQSFFSQVPGFMAFKVNERMRGAFVKFASAAEADEALKMAADHGVPTAKAKSSMSKPNELS